ncbi:MAG: HAD family hydrolase [Methylophilales bacterium 39-45-7]|nr:MAG: HAD family hydrolase [Methylophilales bacterium 39-45-7]
MGLSPLSAQQASSIIGLGLRESIDALYPDISDDQALALASNYNSNYFANESEILLFSGAAETIKTLNRRGHKLAVATGKSRRGLNLALEHTQLRNYFHATRTVDECFSKPHPQMLDELMDDLIALPERTLMIGDTSYDLHMAKNAGVPSIGVTYGAQSADDWQGLAPVQQFDNFATLSQWLLENA